MSRGLGRLQRQILIVLEAAPESLTVAEAAAAVYGQPPTPAQQANVRRAVRQLSDTGLVFHGRGKAVPTGHKTSWGKDVTLHVPTWTRFPPTQAEIEAERASPPLFGKTSK